MDVLYECIASYIITIQYLGTLISRKHDSVNAKSWNSLVEGDEASNRPNSQAHLVIVLYELSLGTYCCGI